MQGRIKILQISSHFEGNEIHQPTNRLVWPKLGRHLVLFTFFVVCFHMKNHFEITAFILRVLKAVLEPVIVPHLAFFRSS